MKKRTAAILLILGIATLTVVLVWGIAAGTPNGFYVNPGTASAGSGAETEVFQTEVPAADVRNVDLGLISQDVAVSADGSDTIRVVQYGPAGLDDAYIIRANQNGDTLRIESPALTHGWSFFGIGSVPYSRVVVTMPSELAGRLDAATASGAVRVEGIRAKECTAGTASGDVSLTDVEANHIEASTVSGAVRLTDVQADDAQASTTSGRVSVDGTTKIGRLETGVISGDIMCRLENLGEFNGESTSGSMLISVVNAADLKRISADTISGSVEVSLPQGTKVNPDFSSISGKMRVAEDGEGAVTVSGQGIPVTVSTTSGDLRITAV